MATSSPQSPRQPKSRQGGDLSTSPSPSDIEDEYVVDKIIAQTMPDGGNEEGQMYLVRWEGCPDEQCTWEPRESFLSQVTLEQWARDKAEKQILTQDEVNEIVRKMDAYAEMEEERAKRRCTEELVEIRKSKPTIASEMDQSLPHTSRRESHDSPGPTGSRLMKAHNDTRAELPSPSTKATRGKKFQEIGVKPRARRSSHHPQRARPKGAPGMPFKNLSTQYRHQKAGRDEPAPDIGKIKLKSVTDIIAPAGEDIAHILPSGESRQAPFHDADAPSTQVLLDRDNQIEPVLQKMRTNSVQMPLAPAQLQPDSGSGELQRISGVSPNSVSPVNHPRRRNVHYLPNGRYWLHGEVLIHLTVHKEEVGDVRIGELPRWFRAKMIAVKIEHQILLDFRQVEMWQYDALCRGRSNDLLANAYLTSFDDTEAALTELADSLDHNSRAALWYHPTAPYVLVAYAAASNAWRFLDGGNTFPSECKIHLALRNSMPNIETVTLLQASEGQAASAETTACSQTGPTFQDPLTRVVNPSHIVQQDVEASLISSNAGSRTFSCSNESLRHPSQSEPLMSTNRPVDDVSEGESLVNKSSTNVWPAGKGVEPDSDSFGSSPESVERPVSPVSFILPSAEDVDAVFQTRFGISYDYLTRPSVMPTSRKDALDASRARFYLAFPLSCQTEMEALRALLSHHTLPNLICTSADPQGWDGFKTILGDKMDHRGVIIFHVSYTHYSALPGLATLLKMANVNIFNLSLQQLLPYCDFPSHIERLFPNGTAILLTESSMAQQPDGTLAILRWFSQMAKTKRGTWKIVLFPNVRHWLLQRAMHPDALQARYLDMLMEIWELSSGQTISYWSLADGASEIESLDGYDDEDGKPGLVVCPVCIPAYDRCREESKDLTDLKQDRVLVEWFAGWAAQNAQRHRKFTAISGVAKQFNLELDEWGHIEVVDPIKYLIQNKIALQRPSPKHPSN